jgi:transposase InsO family protein
VPLRKRGPKTRWSDVELVARIRTSLETSRFVGEGYRKVWAKLRHEGVRTSKERVRRLMREHGLQAPARARRNLGPQNHDGRITTDRPDQMWGTDLTATMTIDDGQVAVFIAVDHCTGECIGIHAAKRATRYEALEPILQGVREHFGAVDKDVAAGLKVRHDHGSQYVSDHFQKELSFLGIEASPAFVRAPEGNGCAERFIKTLKEQLLWIHTFDTVEDLRLALLEWRHTYNEHWLVEKHGYESPAATRRRLLDTRAAA